MRPETAADCGRGRQLRLRAASQSSHRLPRLARQRHHALLVALAADHEEALVARRDVDRQRHQLGDAQPGRVEHLDQRMQPSGRLRSASLSPASAASAAARSSQPPGFGHRHRLRQRPRPAGAVQRAGRFVGAQPFSVEELEELAQRRQPPRLRRGGKAAAGMIGEIARGSRRRRHRRAARRGARPRLRGRGDRRKACWRWRPARRSSFRGTPRCGRALIAGRDRLSRSAGMRTVISPCLGST